MTQIMKTKDIIGIIKSLPLDFMESTASELGTDYKAKKLGSIRLFTLLLLAFLRNSTMSQRFTCEQSSCELLDDFLGISIPVTPLSHSSLADRLATMNPVFFARVYEKVFGMAEKELGTDELSSSDIIRVYDSGSRDERQTQGRYRYRGEPPFRRQEASHKVRYGL